MASEMEEQGRMEQQFGTVITSKRRTLSLHLRETLQYRDLILLFVKRDWTAMYKQTVLGPLWALIQPLMSTIVFTIVFGNLAQLTTADTAGDYLLPEFLFYMIGNICWNYFSTTLQATSDIFWENGDLMDKVYFPRLVSPIAAACSRLISFGIQCGLFVLLWLYFLIRGGTSIRVTPMLLMLPLLVLQMMVLALGCGIVVSSLTTKYRDLDMLVDFALGLWRYACPLAYGLQLIPEKYMGIYLLNPVTPILTTVRRAVFGFGFFDLRMYIVSWIVSLAVLLLGLVLFSHVERTFMDTI